ncbi:hypothetical protein [Blastopirellula marina]|uniref:hypothetical protein n=1 Tax=Blastopirellula marina TaxID=124 RepID=UPI00130480A2|nr:hypothetical protein [Blastopirellula marina]
MTRQFLTDPPHFASSGSTTQKTFSARSGCRPSARFPVNMLPYESQGVKTSG